MNESQNVEQFLEDLLDQGKHLLDANAGIGTLNTSGEAGAPEAQQAHLVVENPDSFEIRSWLARVKDALTRLLPTGSALLAEFGTVCSSANGVRESETLHRPVQQGIRILQYAADELRHTRLQAQAFRFSEDERQRMVQSVEASVNANVITKYFKSWQILVPGGILLVAALFAIAGVIQIRTYNLSVAEIAERAIKNAKQDVESQTAHVKNELATMSSTEKLKIQAAVSQHINALKQEKAPHAEKLLSDLSERLSMSEKRLNASLSSTQSLENELLVLKNLMESVRKGTPKELALVGVMLRLWWLPLGIPVGISIVALLLSVFAMRRTRKKNVPN